MKNASNRLTKAVDHVKFGFGEPVDLGAVDADLARVLDHLLRTRHVELLRSLALRCSRAHGQMSKMLTGETGIDAMGIAAEIASIRQCIAILRLGDHRAEAIASRGEHRHPPAAAVQ